LGSEFVSTKSRDQNLGAHSTMMQNCRAQIDLALVILLGDPAAIFPARSPSRGGLLTGDMIISGVLTDWPPQGPGATG
jgi:hypothetical protein